MNDLFFYDTFSDFDRFMVPAVGFSRSNSDSARAFRPRLDLHEDAQKNVVTATVELPGIKKEDIQLDVRNGLLTVTAEKNASNAYEENGYSVRERQYGKSSRSISLPQGVKEQDIKAALVDGVLTVTFPKNTPEQTPKKIAIA